ncbi:MAG: metallophosphoesterase [Planctomycetota bacterium]|nr:metallophosphoesterase [Planctomycetota bacterium]
MRHRFLVVLAFLLVVGHGAPGQDPDVIDGPHVIWESEKYAMVWRVQQGKAVHVPIKFERGWKLDVPALGAGGVTLAPEPPMVEPDQFDDVTDIFIVGDSHGQFMVFADVLRYGDVVDEDLHWSFGEGHLVIVGDVFDRGDRVTDILWLIYRLEQEAKAQGGFVHFILGNHEVMPLQGDVRYVNPIYLETVAPLMSRSYSQLFGPDTELGQWLRTKHVAIRINDLLFAHGGLSSTLIEKGWDLDFINSSIRANLDTPKVEIRADEDMKLLFGSEGPLWYRGYFIDWSHYQRTTPERIRTTLDHFGGNHVIVAHTGATEIHSLYEGMVINVHVRMKPRGVAEALQWKDGEFERVIVGVTRAALDLTNEQWKSED